MITTRRVSEQDWPAFAAHFRDLTFEQTLTYSRAAADRIGASVRFLAIERDGQPLAAASVRLKSVPGLGRGVAWIPAGPLVLPSDGAQLGDDTLRAAFEALRRQLVGREGHILYLRLPGVAFHEPSTVAGLAAAAGFAPSNRFPGYESLAIDLGKDADTLMRDLNGKWRTDLRYALKSGLSLERGYSLDLKSRFLDLFREVQNAKGFNPEITPEFHFALSGPDLAYDILIATKDGQDLGGIVIGTTGQTAVYLFGATSGAGRRLRAGYLLTWEGISLSRQRGLVWYDLGGVDLNANPDVARFKQRMNGVEINAAGPFEASPGGWFPGFVRVLEAVRAPLRRRR